jgi:hypothetical protein
MRAVMKIQMPQRQRMFGFKAAHLVAVQPVGRAFATRCLPFWRATPVIALLCVRNTYVAMLS